MVGGAELVGALFDALVHAGEDGVNLGAALRDLGQPALAGVGGTVALGELGVELDGGGVGLLGLVVAFQPPEDLAAHEVGVGELFGPEHFLVQKVVHLGQGRLVSPRIIEGEHAVEAGVYMSGIGLQHRVVVGDRGVVVAGFVVEVAAFEKVARQVAGTKGLGVGGDGGGAGGGAGDGVVIEVDPPDGRPIAHNLPVPGNVAAQVGRGEGTGVSKVAQPEVERAPIGLAGHGDAPATETGAASARRGGERIENDAVHDAVRALEADIAGHAPPADDIGAQGPMPGDGGGARTVRVVARGVRQALQRRCGGDRARRGRIADFGQRFAAGDFCGNGTQLGILGRAEESAEGFNVLIGNSKYGVIGVVGVDTGEVKEVVSHPGQDIGFGEPAGAHGQQVGDKLRAGLAAAVGAGRGLQRGGGRAVGGAELLGVGGVALQEERDVRLVTSEERAASTSGGGEKLLPVGRLAGDGGELRRGGGGRGGGAGSGFGRHGGGRCGGARSGSRGDGGAFVGGVNGGPTLAGLDLGGGAGAIGLVVPDLADDSELIGGERGFEAGAKGVGGMGNCGRNGVEIELGQFEEGSTDERGRLVGGEAAVV